MQAVQAVMALLLPNDTGSSARCRARTVLGVARLRYAP
jgi:hypothetical protein